MTGANINPVGSNLGSVDESTSNGAAPSAIPIPNPRMSRRRRSVSGADIAEDLSRLKRRRGSKSSMQGDLRYLFSGVFFMYFTVSNIVSSFPLFVLLVVSVCSNTFQNYVNLLCVVILAGLSQTLRS